MGAAQTIRKLIIEFGYVDLRIAMRNGLTANQFKRASKELRQRSEIVMYAQEGRRSYARFTKRGCQVNNCPMRLSRPLGPQTWHTLHLLAHWCSEAGKVRRPFDVVAWSKKIGAPVAPGRYILEKMTNEQGDMTGMVIHRTFVPGDGTAVPSIGKKLWGHYSQLSKVEAFATRIETKLLQLTVLVGNEAKEQAIRRALERPKRGKSLGDLIQVNIFVVHYAT